MQLLFESATVLDATNMAKLSETFSEEILSNGTTENFTKDISIGDKEDIEIQVKNLPVQEALPNSKNLVDENTISGNVSPIETSESEKMKSIDDSVNDIKEITENTTIAKEDVSSTENVPDRQKSLYNSVEFNNDVERNDDSVLVEQNKNGLLEKEKNMIESEENPCFKEDSSVTKTNCDNSDVIEVKLVESAQNLDRDVVQTNLDISKDVGTVIDAEKNVIETVSTVEKDVDETALKLNKEEIDETSINQNNNINEISQTKTELKANEIIQENSCIEPVILDNSVTLNKTKELSVEESEIVTLKSDQLKATEVNIIDVSMESENDNCKTSNNIEDNDVSIVEDITELQDLPKDINIKEKENCTDAEDTDDKQKGNDENNLTESEAITSSSNFEIGNEAEIKKPSMICKLSNTLDILSDDEDDPSKTYETPKNENQLSSEKQCINIDDDDDVMLIEEEFNNKNNTEENKTEIDKTKKNESNDLLIVPENVETKLEDSSKVTIEQPHLNNIEEPAKEEIPSDTNVSMDTDLNVKPDINVKITELPKEKIDQKPLLPENFLKSAKKNLTDMTRNDLEEFCILKIVESIVDRSSLNEIKAKLKSVTQTVDEYRKKATMLSKQNRDLQVVLKSIQEEQKKSTDTLITPLKITGSVGVQVLMTDKAGMRRKPPQTRTTSIANTRPQRSTVNQTQTQKTTNNNINSYPVPRLVPAAPVVTPKVAAPVFSTANQNKTLSPVPNGVRVPSPAQKAAEKRTRGGQSVTVDLTDDEPPTKMATRTPVPPVRLVPPQNLLTPRQAFASSGSPRKVYIPISGPQSQTIRPGQTIMLKTMPTVVPRQRCPQPQVRVPQQNPVRTMPRVNRHPAPLPDAVKQYQPPNWKALPPTPDLKLSKVENGIVISWKIDGYSEDTYEEIASYQLYAYQETSSPPSTALWKKIGDVKALPLPMACTLTQFMPGFKYYFAVRAVDIRSRLGPFSLPGSIILLNKL